MSLSLSLAGWSSACVFMNLYSVQVVSVSFIWDDRLAVYSSSVSPGQAAC
jgi:hypothetical protein